MNIVVCIKQVPDTNEVKLDPKTGTLIREGVPSIINPDDKAGLEAALRIKDKTGAKVSVISMGPPQADLALREALAMGADEAILVTDRAFGGADTWATSSTLASALKKLPFDLIITGRQAIDGDTAQVGPLSLIHISVDYTMEAVKQAEVVIAQVNQFMPRTHGDSFVHVSEISDFVEFDEPIIELPNPKITDVEEAIGRNCASLIHDGDCLQLGIGAIPDAVLLFLKDKKDLGIHSEMISDGVVELVEAGVITNKKKTLHPGKSIRCV